MTENRTQLGFTGYPCLMSQFGHPTGFLNVFLQIQAGSIHHHRIKTQLDGFPNNIEVVDPLPILINYRDVIQMQAYVMRVAIFLKLLVHGRHASTLKLPPLRPSHFYQGKDILIDYRPDHRFQHGKVRYVESRNQEAGLPGIGKDLCCCIHFIFLQNYFDDSAGAMQLPELATGEATAGLHPSCSPGLPDRRGSGGLSPCGSCGGR
ncbi:hypothetical protein ES707_11272 [subsurface metagenome]